MSKDTTDELRETLLDKLAIIKYGEPYKWLFDVDKLKVDLWTKDLQALISNREKLAMIDALEKTMPHTDGMRHYNTVKARIATLRKELDGGGNNDGR